MRFTVRDALLALDAHTVVLTRDGDGFRAVAIGRVQTYHATAIEPEDALRQVAAMIIRTGHPSVPIEITRS